MRNGIKVGVVESGRYNQIVEILQNIIKIEDSSLPTNAYIVSGQETKWRVDGNSLRSEAKELLNIITSDTIDIIPKHKDFLNLYIYVETCSDKDLHNYANAIAHRSEPDVNMEEIRAYLVLNAIIDDFFYIGDLLNYVFDAPTGWKVA